MRGLFGTLALSGACLAIASNAPAQPSVAAPAVTASIPADDLETLKDRTAMFWAARVNGDANGQFELLEPRGKARTTPLDYAGRPGAMRYLAYQVEDASVKGFFATVKVRLVIQPFLQTQRPTVIPPAATVVEDKWVRIRGTWYRALEQE